MLLSATLTIRGVRPLLWHRFGPDSMPLEKQERSGVAGNDPTEWQKTVLYTSDGQLYVDPTYIFGALREAGKYTKKGRGSIMTAVSATLQVMDDRVLIDRWIPDFDGVLPDAMPTDVDLPVYLDIRGVKNPATKGRNVRYRVACSPGWLATAHIIWDATIVSRGEIHAVAIDAGRLCGIGDGRSIGFGRFEIESFDITG